MKVLEHVPLARWAKASKIVAVVLSFGLSATVLEAQSVPFTPYPISSPKRTAALQPPPATAPAQPLQAIGATPLPWPGVVPAQPVSQVLPNVEVGQEPPKQPVPMKQEDKAKPLPEPRVAVEEPADDGPNYTLAFTDGVLFKTNDSLFSLKINDLLQMDYRDFSQTSNVHGPLALHSQFTIPRQWLFFRGNATEYFDYAAVIAAGAAAALTGPATVNLLDAYIDFNPVGAEYKKLFQVRVGRFKTPYGYEFYSVSPQDFMTPELSMYSTNLLQNRQLGAMLHGLLWDERIDYAAGVFNGAPNSFEVPFDNREGIFYLGLAPFLLNDNRYLKNLHLIGSMAVGDQFGAPLPGAFSTAVPSAGPPNNSEISPTFLTFGPKTIQNGARTLWACDLVYSLGSFNLYGEGDGGYLTYGLLTKPGKSFTVPVSGYSLTASYFLTGEQISFRRARLEPLRPYSWHNRTWGAFEAFGRYSNFTLGSNVITDKLAVPNSANKVDATDIGVNWYLNQYIKFVFDWQHSMFNLPIALGPDKTTSHQDLYWLRWQIYY